MKPHFIQSIKIENFKSFRLLEMNTLKRINLIIGRPNVGKSNVIEALSVFSLPYFKLFASSYVETRKLNSVIRLENFPDLFYKGNYRDKAVVEITSSTGSLTGFFELFENRLPHAIITKGKMNQIATGEHLFTGQINSELAFIEFNMRQYFTGIKRFIFDSNHREQTRGIFSTLLSPFGQNLGEIVSQSFHLKEFVELLIRDYGLVMKFDTSSGKLKFNIGKKDDDFFLLSFNSIADTIQRIIFYKAAIVSNQNSVLLFEEPEAHAFPPYMKYITQQILHSETNQFFIATHSPFIITEFLESDEARTQLAIHVMDYKGGQTVVRTLTDAEMHDAYQYGMDLLTNVESFL